MLNYIPVIGWIATFIFSTFISIPFYFIWNWLAPTYFAFLPKVYLDVPFWDCVGMFMLMPMVKILVYPRRMIASSSSESKSDKD